MQNANRADLLTGQPDDAAPRTAQLTMQRLHPLDRRVKTLRKELFENVHECDLQRFSFDQSSAGT
jgi:hypothetical protein